MKKIMAVFAVVLLLFQCPGGTAEPLAQAAAEANILIRFEETFMQAFALGDTAAYVLDHQGMLWTWHYNEDEPQAICQLAPYPETVFSSGKPYKEMDGADQAVAADTVQVLAEARGALYGVNQLAGRIGTVDGEGIHWQREFDAALLLTSQGEARYIMGQAVVGETLYLLEADWEKGENAAQLASLDLQTGETRLMDAPEGAASLCAYGEELLLLGGDGNLRQFLYARTVSARWSVCPGGRRHPGAALGQRGEEPGSSYPAFRQRHGCRADPGIPGGLPPGAHGYSNPGDAYRSRGGGGHPLRRSGNRYILRSGG